MTLPRLHRLCRYWSRHPPPHLLLAAVYGTPSRERQGDDLGELLAMGAADGVIHAGKVS